MDSMDCEEDIDYDSVSFIVNIPSEIYDEVEAEGSEDEDEMDTDDE